MGCAWPIPPREDCRRRCGTPSLFDGLQCRLSRVIRTTRSFRSLLLAFPFLSAAGLLAPTNAEVLASSSAWTGQTVYGQSVALDDVDGDGRLDLVCGNQDSTVTFYSNTGAGFTSRPAWSGAMGQGASVVLGDMNGDGLPDLIRGNGYIDVSWAGGPPKLYLNLGGSFSSTAAWTGTGAYGSCMALGDVDGDGRLDLVCGAWKDGSLLFLNGSSGLGSVPAWTGPPDTTQAVVLGDVDGDGRLDLVCATTVGAKLYLNTGGSFTSSPVWIGPPGAGVALGDVNGDGRLDLVCQSTAESRLYLNTGGALATSASWVGPGSGVTWGWGSVSLGDVDGDERLDVALSGPNPMIILNAGGTFAPSHAWTGRSETTVRVVLADVDGDGLLDLMRGNSTGGSTLYLNVTGKFGSTPAWPGPVETTLGVALGDVDGDGKLDLVRGNFRQVATLYLNTGGTFGTSRAWAGPVENTAAVALGDVNGDGRPDLIRGNTAGKTTLYFNHAGTFGSTPDWSGPAEPTDAVALGDVNDDGRLDLVRGNSGQRTSLYLNQGGTLASTPIWVGALAATYGVALGDVNGDGRPDLVQGNRPSTQLYLNSGAGFAAVSAWTGPGTNCVALGDVDGDGRPDLLCGASPSLYRNTGSSFASTASWSGPAEGTTYAVALGDVDGDGRLDLVRGNYGQGSTLYLNTGDAFGLDPEWTGLDAPTYSVALGDVNGDGRLDVVFGSENGSTLYLNRSPWLLGPDTSAAGRQLPNNPAHLRWVRVAQADSNLYRIIFQAVDVEADRIWVVGEYQYEGSPVWRAMELDGNALRAGPFATSPSGEEHEISWNVMGLSFDRRNVVIRLRAVSASRWVVGTQFIPAYLMKVGPVTPARPALVAAPANLVFPTMTVGDTALLSLRLSNPGTRDLVIDQVESPDTALSVGVAPGLVIAPGQQYNAAVVLAPRRAISSLGPLRIHGNDPTAPVVEVPIATDVRSLDFSSRLLATAPEIPLGEAATIIVTPAQQVHILGGFVCYRARGAASFADSSRLVAQGANFAALIPGNAVTEAGLEFFIRVENSGVVAVDPPGAPDSSFFQPVAAPSGITVVPQPTSRSEFLQGRDIVVQVSTPVGAEFVSGVLYYRPGGASAYDSTLVAVSDILHVPVGVIPAAIVGARGVEYWVAAQTMTRRLTWPALNAAASPDTLRITVGELSEPEQRPGGRYRMLSVPLDFGPGSTGSLADLLVDQSEFGTYDPVRWRSFVYDPGLGANVEYADSTVARFRPAPGRAFWLISRQAHRVDVAPVSGLSTATRRDYALVLQPGWNQVGDPFDFPVAWSAVRKSAAVGEPVAFDPALGTIGDYADTPPTVLDPFEGCFAFNAAASAETLWVPAQEAAASVAASPARAAASMGRGWRVRLRARSEHALDGANLFGVDPAAAEGRDALDLPKPPLPPGPWVRLGFAHPEWSGGPTLYRRDLRAPTSEGHAWAIEITSAEVGEPITLECEADSTLAAGQVLRLIDVEQQAAVELKGAGRAGVAASYRLIAFGPGRPYRLTLLAGVAEYVARGSDSLLAMPERLLLDPVAPNPIHASTRFRFGLPRAGPVRLEVFGVRGERVAKLMDGAWQAPGYHTLIWNGTGSSGAPVPSGIYYARLQAGGMSLTRRLVVVR